MVVTVHFHQQRPQGRIWRKRKGQSKNKSPCYTAYGMPMRLYKGHRHFFVAQAKAKGSCPAGASCARAAHRPRGRVLCAGGRFFDQLRRRGATCEKAVPLFCFCVTMSPQIRTAASYGKPLQKIGRSLGEVSSLGAAAWRGNILLGGGQFLRGRCPLRAGASSRRGSIPSGGDSQNTKRRFL